MPTSAGNVLLATPDSVHALQRALGNIAVGHLLDRRAAAGGAVAASRSSVAPGHIQRHSSWEHYLLGTVDPADLRVIASGRDAKAKEKRGGGALVTEQGQRITSEDAVHALDQEIRRLQLWQSDPPTSGGSAGEAHLKTLDAQWQVRLVEIKYTPDPTRKTILTYGEMNTMADLYGSPDEMKNADPARLQAVVQGVRQQAWLKMLKLRGELDTSWFGETFKIHKGFEGTKGATGRYEPKWLPVGEGRNVAMDKGNDAPEEAYTAGLARNACHFAPQCWRAWEEYHTRAIGLARQAAAANEQARRLNGQSLNPFLEPEEAARLKEAAKDSKQRAESLTNEALMQNAFGDHFLQDAYAAGHLINKTLIMQWYMAWIDAGNHWHYMKDEKWARIRKQMSEAQQPGLQGSYAAQTGIRANDPQSVENLNPTNPFLQPEENEAQGRSVRFAALGLTTPQVLQPGQPGKDLVMWWQTVADGPAGKLTVSLATLRTIRDANPALAQLDGMQLTRILDDLAAAGVAKKEVRKSSPKGAPSYEYSLAAEYHRTARTNQENPQTFSDKFDKRAEEVTYAGFHDFLNSALLQAGTNVLHDIYCRDGLVVRSHGNEAIGKIYGDESMLQAGSGPGVQYSAETAKRSRQSIFNVLDGQAEGFTTAQIFSRLPGSVIDTAHGSTPGGGVSIEQWHTDPSHLRKYCEQSEGAFSQAAGSFGKGFVVGEKETLTGQVSKDVHSGSAF